MEDLSEFIKNSYEYLKYFIKEDDCNDLDDEF